MRVRILLLAVLVAMEFPALAAQKVRVVDEGALGEQWTLVPGSQLMPPYPEVYSKDPENVCLVVGYLVNADGHTSDFALLKSWTSGSNAKSRNKFWAEFGDLTSRALAQWRYTPKAVASAPVYTAATFVFSAPGAVADTKAHCTIADLTTRLVELRYDSRARRLMAGGIFSRLDIDPYVEERIRQQFIGQRETEDTAREIKQPVPSLPPPVSGTPPSGNK